MLPVSRLQYDQRYSVCEHVWGATDVGEAEYSSAVLSKLNVHADQFAAVDLPHRL